MSQYLNTAKVNGERVKDLYRIRAIYDERTGDFLREYTEKDIKNKTNPTGELIGEDIYIECTNGDMIYDINPREKIMQLYFSSRNRGRNRLRKMCKDLLNKDYDKLVKAYNKEGYGFHDYSKLNKLYNPDGNTSNVKGVIGSENWFVFNITEGDEELWFDFYLKDIDKISKYVGICKPYKSKTAYQKRYLPSYEETLKKKREAEDSFVKHVLPKDAWKTLKKEVTRVMKDKKLKLDTVYDFIYEEFGKKHKQDFIKESLEQKEGKYKTPHYIDKIGLFDELIKFVKSM